MRDSVFFIFFVGWKDGKTFNCPTSKYDSNNPWEFIDLELDEDENIKTQMIDSKNIKFGYLTMWEAELMMKRLSKDPENFLEFQILPAVIPISIYFDIISSIDYNLHNLPEKVEIRHI